MDVVSTDQFVIHPSVICRELSGETVLLNLESGVDHGLDAVGTRVWQLLMQGCTIASVRDTMIEDTTSRRMCSTPTSCVLLASCATAASSRLANPCRPD